MTQDSIPVCQGPDPDPKKPSFEIPPLACDTHAHIFGPESKYDYSPRRGYTPPDASLEDFLRLHAVLGMERGVLTQPSVYGTDNSAMLDAVAREPDRLRAVAAVDETVTDAELERLNDAGVRGIRVNIVDKGGMPFSDMSAVEHMGDRIRDLGWHIEVLIHVSDFPDLRKTFARFPVDIVFGHLGYMKTDKGLDNPGFQDFLSLLSDGRAWVKLTGTYRITTMATTPYDDVQPYGAALIETAPDRVLWGSDWPHPFVQMQMPNDGDLLNMLADFAPDAAMRKRILVDNPIQLYGFE